MLNKNVCPNCGQLYDTSLDKCPLCGTAPQVVETGSPVQRKRITEAERKQRRSDSRREAEQASRRSRRSARYQADADEELRVEEEDARRREEKRRRQAEKKARRRAEQARELATVPNSTVPGFSPAPARDGRGPMPAEPFRRDRKRVPRVFLILSALVLAATLLVAGSYLLWKLDVVRLPVYDRLAGREDAPAPADTDSPATEAPKTEAPATTLYRGEGAVPCKAVTLAQSFIDFTAAGEQTQLTAELSPANTTDERRFESSDTSVVKVSPVGIVTAVGPGEASITVTCGEVSAVCYVHCNIAETEPPTLPPDITELVLDKDDMTFFAAGENYRLAVTNIPPDVTVEWRSLDESIATVDERGHVVAVGQGTTRVFASAGGLETFCWVRCRFD